VGFKQASFDELSSHHIAALISLINAAFHLTKASKYKLVLNLHHDNPRVHEDFI
jgi:hypothetical protein